VEEKEEREWDGGKKKKKEKTLRNSPHGRGRHWLRAHAQHRQEKAVKVQVRGTVLILVIATITAVSHHGLPAGWRHVALADEGRHVPPRRVQDGRKGGAKGLGGRGRARDGRAVARLVAHQLQGDGRARHGVAATAGVVVGVRGRAAQGQAWAADQGGQAVGDLTEDEGKRER
jgi:hypothetical protein